MSLSRYDIRQSYEWNYRHPPEVPRVEVPVYPGEFSLCGMELPSPLGVPAGPLLNGRWCLFYAALGFDLLTYKTVRSVARDCYPLPNLQPTEDRMLQGGEPSVETAESPTESWAVSFGMPSRKPDVWREDVRWTRQQLGPQQKLAVSVVGTVQPDWTLEDLAEDYAQCAAWAVESGADLVETNFSCPNVSTCDGQLYQIPADAARIAAQVRQRIGSTPYAVKIGHLPDAAATDELLRGLAPYVDALAMTNSVATRVMHQGEPLFGGQLRGICGKSIRTASLRQVSAFSQRIRALGLQMEIIAVGGAGTLGDVQDYLEAGAGNVQLATAAMLDPEVGLRIRNEAAGCRPGA